MSVDWFTFTAQLLNFALLVWLLKRFLYRPILDAIAAREKRISAELADAAAVKAAARDERERFERNNRDLEQQREALIDRARQEAHAEYERLVAAARAASDEFGRKRMQALRSSVENLEQAMGQRVQHEVFAITRKILDELASESLQERMTATFLSRLQTLDADRRGRLRAVVASKDALLLRSAFELAQSQRDAIRAALVDMAGSEVGLHFEALPDLVSGIELIADGHKIAWSISDYLATLEKKVGEMLPANKTDRHPDQSARPRERQNS